MEVGTCSKDNVDHTYSQSSNSTDKNASQINVEQFNMVSQPIQSECKKTIDTSWDTNADMSANKILEPNGIVELYVNESNTNIACPTDTSTTEIVDALLENHSLIDTSTVHNVDALPENHIPVTQSCCSNSQLPVFTMCNSDIGSRASQKHECYTTSSPLSTYEGLFSVEQHFVCLACCSCFQSDSALVVHLQIHITNNGIKLNVASDAKNDKHLLRDKIDKLVSENASKVGVFSSYRTKFKYFQKSTGHLVTNKLNYTDMSNKDHDNTSTVQPMNCLPLSSEDMNSIPVSNLPMKVAPVPVPSPLHPVSIFPGCLVVQNAINPVFLTTIIPEQNIENRLNGTSSSQTKVSHNNNANLLVTGNCSTNSAPQDNTEEKFGFSDDHHLDMDNTSTCRKMNDSTKEVPINNMCSEDNNDFPLCTNGPSDSISNTQKTSRPILKKSSSEREYSTWENPGNLNVLYRSVFTHDKQIVPKEKREQDPPQLCDICGKVFSQGASYRRHIRQVHSAKTYECDKCGKCFSLNYPFKRHKEKLCPVLFDQDTITKNKAKKIKHEEIRGEAIKCNFCMRVFDRPARLARHQRLCAMEKTIPCPVCKKLFAVQSQLKDHLKCHGERKYKCDLCSKTFLDKLELASHTRRHTGERPYPCIQCGHRSYTKIELSRHLQVHSSDLPYSCTFCPKSFRYLTTLTNHMTTHTGERHIQCDSCTLKFRTASKLKVHKNCKHNADVSKIFSCYNCCRIFSDSFHFRLHLKTHASTNPYRCHVCGLKCSTKNQLAQHTEIHTGNQPFTCTICRNGFFRKKNLIKHLEVHAVQRTQCVICKELLVTQDVVAHMETHDRRYRCDECGERFHTQTILTEHLKTHFGDKPHICHICNMRFLTYARLLAHLRIHSVTLIADVAC